MSKVALITGTSKGIGLSLTKILLKNNFTVYGYSRSNKLKNPNFYFNKINLSEIHKLKNMFFPKLDFADDIFLINNAGEIGEINKYGNKKRNNIVNEININLTAPTLLSNRFIKEYDSLKARLTILNVSSGAALRPIECWGTYCQSKAGLDMLTKIINEENNNIKIKNLSLNDSNQIIKIDQANFNYLDTENKKNNYNIKKVEGQNLSLIHISEPTRPERMAVGGVGV